LFPHLSDECISLLPEYCVSFLFAMGNLSQDDDGFF